MTNKSPTLVSPKSTNHKIAEVNSITPLALRSMFWRPLFLKQSDWLVHIPFAFWLIEAHQPKTLVELGSDSCVSYFAMCQAVDRLQLETDCYAFGAWNGEDVSQVKYHNVSHYSAFSHLMSGDAHTALESFADNSIDLIHFNNLGGYENGRLTINAWLPKLSNNGLILINGTSSGEHGRAVRKLLDELKESNHTFEFRNGNGLAILEIGSTQAKLLQVLFDDVENKQSSQIVRDVFSRLGQACADNFNAREHESKVNSLVMEAEKLNIDFELLEDTLASTRRKLKDKNGKMGELQVQIAHQVESQALERGQLVERSSMIQKLYEELKTNTETLKDSVDSSAQQLRNQDKELYRLSAEKSIIENELKQSRSENEGLKNQLAANKQSCLHLSNEIQELKNMLNSAREAGNSALEKIKTIQVEHDAQLTSLMKKAANEKNEYESRIEILNREVIGLRENLVQSEDLLNTVEREATNQREHSERIIGELKSRNEYLQTSLDARFVEIAKLTQLIEAKKTKLETEIDRKVSGEWKQARRTPKAPVQRKRVTRQDSNPHKKTDQSIFKSTLKHLEMRKHIKLLKASPLFDPDWYLEQYPDLQSSNKAKRNPAWHYVECGGFESRNPSDAFDSDWYLTQNPDVEKEGTNPLVHFILNGKAEGRLPMPFSEF